MSAAHWHLLLSHLPVVGTLCALVLLLLSLILPHEILRKVACGFFLANAALAAVAYYTGAPAAEVLDASAWELDQPQVERHGLIARVTFVGMIILGVVALQMLLQYAQGGKPARWISWVLLALAVVLCYLLAWTAHLGGLIHHPEIREPELWWFPSIR